MVSKFLYRISFLSIVILAGLCFFLPNCISVQAADVSATGFDFPNVSGTYSSTGSTFGGKTLYRLGVQNYWILYDAIGVAWDIRNSSDLSGTLYFYISTSNDPPVGHWSAVAGFLAGNTSATSPPTLTTNSVSTYGTSTATYSGTISSTGGSDATESGFASGTVSTLTGGSTATSTLGSQTSTATFTSSVTGLTSATTYYVRAYATNSAGTGLGSIVSFTTTSITAPTVTTEAGSSVTATGATLNGTITAIGNNGTTQSGFAYGTGSTLTSPTATSTLGSQQGTASFSEAITSLTCNTTYYFRPYATNSAGTGYGSITSLTTSPCVSTLTTDTVTSLTTTTGTLNATISATGGDNASQSGFAYSTDSTFVTVLATSTLGTQSGAVSFTEDITGLTCATTYYSRAYATNSAGTTYGSSVSFLTSDCPVTTTTTAPTPGSSSRRRQANLQQISNSVLPTNSPAPTPSFPLQPGSNFTTDLSIGSSGVSVKNLQKYLNINGYIIATTGHGSPGNETTFFGPLTRKALIKFQLDHQITPAVGYFGPITRGVVGKDF